MGTRAVLGHLGALFASAAFASVAFASDAESCKKMRISDIGWTDIMLSNATAELLLKGMGYQPEQMLLGMDITFMSLKNGEIDVFQGNWTPFQNELYGSYFNEGSVEVLGNNLEGAKMTLAVPGFVADAGVKDFADLAQHADQFGAKIYSVEPGSNKRLLDMIAENRHGLGGWDVVETSEAGMLSQVKRSISQSKWITFLAWEPHPMNLDLKISYLTGGDQEFGPNFGNATVRTVSRKGFAAECPNAARLFQNLSYTVDYENRGMHLIMDEGKSPIDAAKELIATSPALLDAWLMGVTTFTGAPALPAVKAQLGL